MGEGNSLDRRTVLRGASAAGMAAVGGVGIASADGDADNPFGTLETEPVSDAVFAELGVEFDVDLEPDSHTTHVPTYRVDEDADRVVALRLTDEDRALIEAEEGLVKHNGLHALPARLTRSDVSHLPVSTTDQLAPSATVAVAQGLRIPAIRVSSTGSGTLEIDVGGRSAAVPAGESDRIALEPRNVRARHEAGEPGASRKDGPGLDAVPEIVVNNHGNVTIEVADVQEGQA